MSFSLKKVAQVVGTVGGIIAAPFTGGASLAISAAAIGSATSDSAANQQKKIVEASADAQRTAEAQAVTDATALQQNALALSPNVTPTSVNNSAKNLAESSGYATINIPTKTDYTPVLIAGGAAILLLIVFLKRK